MRKFVFLQLDGRTRQLMLAELELDRSMQREFVGKRLNANGARIYWTALSFALSDGNPDTLARALEPVPGALWIESTVAVNGRPSTTARTSARTLAEGEFNRYYMRAICLRATAEGDGTVVVVRSKQVDNARSDRLVKVVENERLDAREVLADLRLHPGEDTALGMPRGPNSGLSLTFGRLRDDEHGEGEGSVA